MSAAERSQVVLLLAVNTPRHRGHLARQVSSLLSFFLDFWWNFRAQMRREGEGWSFYRGYPGRPGGGDWAPYRPRGGGDRPPAAPVGWAQRRSPVGWATGPFFSRDFVANLKKKITLWACRPMGGRPGYIFEIFQNGHIFLKF